MTNKELAEKAEGVAARLRMASKYGHNDFGMEHLLTDIAGWLRATEPVECLPDPTPTLEDQLRELVGKHECLSEIFRYMPDHIPDDGRPWSVRDGANRQRQWVAWMSTEMAMEHVRGIVKGLCDERNKEIGNWQRDWSWGPNIHGGWAINDSADCQGPFATELAAIDALLTELAKQKQ